ncbi:hypothetical protein BM1_04761 [Bipolaris maydis]|nr:hypothetical protein BM1_04761 [Bipolaris maydis]
MAAKKEKYLSDSTSSSIVTAILQGYLFDHGPAASLNKQFRSIVSSQIRLFLFAGHDTTGSTLAYCYFLLSKHPAALQRIRAEINDIYGTSHCRDVATAIRDDPPSLNRLIYTLCVIKEALRLYPPASAIREGKPDLVMVDESGRTFPSAECNVWHIHLLLQRNSKYWKDPHEFKPERWLTKPGEALYPPKGGWRPFEFGARNCIGQTLAIFELKIVLAMTVGQFDIIPGYDDWDQTHPNPCIRTVLGNRAYQNTRSAKYPWDSPFKEASLSSQTTHGDPHTQEKEWLSLLAETPSLNNLLSKSCISLGVHFLR